MFNIVQNRELLIARLKREAVYLLSDVSLTKREKVQPFVVVCRQRTGSNMLRYALETHPQVVHYGEIFRDGLERIWGAHGRYFYRHDSLIEWRNRDPRSFLNDVIYRDTSPPIKAVGFKLFYWHGRNGDRASPWRVIGEREDVKVIHLVRTNPIGAFLSTERTLRDGPYVQIRTTGPTRGETAADDGPILVDVARFREYLMQYELYISTFQRELGSHEILELSYEQLSANTNQLLDKVLDFLAVERRPLEAQTLRQSKGNIVSRIVNLDEVAAAHCGTRWASAPDRWKR